MSNDADLEYGPTPAGAQYEHTDIDPAVGYKFGLWLAVSMMIGAGIVYGTYIVLDRMAVSRDQATQQFPLSVGKSQEPPAPRLQTQPFKDVFQLKTEQLGALHPQHVSPQPNFVKTVVRPAAVRHRHLRSPSARTRSRQLNRRPELSTRRTQTREHRAIDPGNRDVTLSVHRYRRTRRIPVPRGQINVREPDRRRDRGGAI